ncbi:MAG: hypothetical protein ACYC3O_10895 [Burkholderiales bacterium]
MASSGVFHQMYLAARLPSISRSLKFTACSLLFFDFTLPADTIQVARTGLRDGRPDELTDAIMIIDMG